MLQVFISHKMQLLALQEVEAGLEGELQGRVIVLVVSRCVALALGSLSGKLEAFGREGLKLLWGEGVADVGEGVGQVNQLAGRVKAKLVWNVLDTRKAKTCILFICVQRARNATRKYFL